MPIKKVGRSEPGEHGTTITFLADDTIFDSLDYEFATLAQRFREMCYLTKGLKIRFVDEREDQEYSFYFEGGIVSFVRHLNKNRQVVHQRPIYAERNINGINVEVALQYIDGQSEVAFFFANNINTIDGGTHQTGFRQALTRTLNEYARKAGILKDNDPNLTGEDVREGLTAIVSVKLPEPQFEGQTKTRLGNSEVTPAGRLGDHRGAGPVPRREPVGRPADHREVPARRARPRGRTEGEGAGDPQERPGRDGAARQAGGLHREEPGAVRDLPGRGRSRPAARPRARAIGGSRRSCRCAARS